jgi:pimeloyl-ACP methyl ester carboxylesterase
VLELGQFREGSKHSVILDALEPTRIGSRILLAELEILTQSFGGIVMRQSVAVRVFLVAIVICASVLLTHPGIADDGEQPLTVDHYVSVRSTAPSMSGQIAKIYVRERLRASTILRAASLANRVVLFIHGGGTPAEVAFDIPYQDYSWMAYLAQAGFDVFAMDVTGYGRSTRPPPMNDPCNLPPDQQAALIPSVLSTPCAASYPHASTALASDWNDIGAVVDYVRSLRQVERLDIVAWSRGGPRAVGYVAQHPNRVRKLVLLAPSYNLTFQTDNSAMSVQSYHEFQANWDSQIGCPGQYEPALRDSVWSEMMKSDAVGATWGPGVRRSPGESVDAKDWTSAVAAKVIIPTLMISGEHDKQVPSARVRELYVDLRSSQKIFIDLACSSHNALWESNHLLLFGASLEWLTRGSVNGKKEGALRLGYKDAKESN